MKPLFRKPGRDLKRILRRVYPVKVPHPNWSQLLGDRFGSWRKLSEPSTPGKKVLLATSVGGHVGVTTFDSLLAVALTLRGAQVDVLLCDEVLPACEHCLIVKFTGESDFLKNGPQKEICRLCFSQAEKMFASLGIPVRKYSQFLTGDDYKQAKEIVASTSIEDIKNYLLNEIPVGEHALAGTLRFYGRGTLDSENRAKESLRRYFEASLLTATAISRLFDQSNYICASFHHGIYVPQGIIGASARYRGVRVVNWMPAYRKKCFIFSHHDTYHHTLMSEPVDRWQYICWTPEMEGDLLLYLRSRWDGSKDWISFNRVPEANLAKIQQDLGVDFTKPCIGLLTNVVWDAQLHYPANIFRNMIEWVEETIGYFAKRPDLQLIVRVHPAENTGQIQSRQPILAEIKRDFPSLPKNVFIIPPTSSISTYAVMLQCSAALIYGTKTGVELTSLGIPVIVAGEAWIRNKGITIDPISRDEYFEVLDRLPFSERLDQETVQRARKYAYHFFFRRMIPVQCTTPAEGFPPYTITINGIADLLPGKDLGLDVICDGILNGTEFIYQAELLHAAPIEDKPSSDLRETRLVG